MIAFERQKEKVCSYVENQSASSAVVWVTCMRTSNVIIQCKIKTNVVSKGDMKSIISSFWLSL